MNLNILYIFVEKPTDYIIFECVTARPQFAQFVTALLTDIWAGNAPTANSPHRPR